MSFFKEPSPGDNAKSEKTVELPPKVMEMLRGLSIEQLERVAQLVSSTIQTRGGARRAKEVEAIESYRKTFIIHGVEGVLEPGMESLHKGNFLPWLYIPQWRIDLVVIVSELNQLEHFINEMTRLEQSTSTAEEAKERLTTALRKVPASGEGRSLAEVRLE